MLELELLFGLSPTTIIFHQESLLYTSKTLTHFERLKTQMVKLSDDKGTPIYRWPRGHRRITKFDTLPEPSMDREKITLTGTFDNGGKFEYNMELNAKGLLFWSELDEPKPAKAKSETDRIVSPTRLHFLVGVPGLFQDAKNVTADKMEKIVGDAYLSLRPQSGKPQKYPFREQWLSQRKNTR